MGVYYVGNIPYGSGDIYHYGVKGMKWGKHIFGEDETSSPHRFSTATSNLSRVNQWRARTALASRTPSREAQQTAANRQWARTARATTARSREEQQNAANSQWARSARAMTARSREEQQNAANRQWARTSRAASARSREEQQREADRNKVAYTNSFAGKVEMGRNRVSAFLSRTLSSISDFAKNAISAGRNWLSSLLSMPLTQKGREAKTTAERESRAASIANEVAGNSRGKTREQQQRLADIHRAHGSRAEQANREVYNDSIAGRVSNARNQASDAYEDFVTKPRDRRAKATADKEHRAASNANKVAGNIKGKTREQQQHLADLHRAHTARANEADRRYEDSSIRTQASRAYDRGRETASDVYNRASGAVNNARTQASRAYDRGREIASDVHNRASGAVNNARNAVSQVYNNVTGETDRRRERNRQARRHGARTVADRYTN